MPTYNAYAVSGIAPPSLRRRRRGVSSHPVLALGAQFPTGPSTTVGPTGARLRVRCLSARGSSGAPSETADFERSNGTGFETCLPVAERLHFLPRFAPICEAAASK